MCTKQSCNNQCCYPHIPLANVKLMCQFQPISPPTAALQDPKGDKRSKAVGEAALEISLWGRICSNSLAILHGRPFESHTEDFVGLRARAGRIFLLLLQHLKKRGKASLTHQDPKCTSHWQAGDHICRSFAYAHIHYITPTERGCQGVTRNQILSRTNNQGGWI